MTKIWNGRLYLEGIKKIRLLGIAFAIVIIVSNALIPLTTFIVTLTQKIAGQEQVYGQTVSEVLFATPTFLLMIFTPFFFYTMFAYLNSRSESDFYHAIPYSRASVFVTFTAAIYTWIFGILIVTVSLNSLLWFVNPYTTFSILTPLKIVLEYVVATLFIGGISAIAVCLTGTKASQFFVTMTLLFFIRISLILFGISVSHLAPVLDLERSLLMLLSPKYYFPFSVFVNFLDQSVMQNAALWIYTGVLAAASNILGCVLYVKRKSETATKSAPNRVFQHVFRILFTLPWVTAIAAMIIYEADISLIFVCANVCIVIYILYELITTKSGKSVLKSLPFLGVLVAVGLLFLGGAHLAKGIILSQEYAPEEIEAVGISPDSGGILYGIIADSSKSYERQQIENLMSKNEEAKKLASDALRKAIENVKNTGSVDGSVRYGYSRDGEYGILIQLKSGRTVGKNVCFSDEDYGRFESILMSSEEYSDALIRVPTQSEVLYAYPREVEMNDQNAWKELYRLFLEDYGKLSREEKISYKLACSNGWDKPGDCRFSIVVSGSSSEGNFNSVYLVPDTFTATAEYLQKLYEEQVGRVVQLVSDVANGAYDSFREDQENSYLSISFQIRTPEGEYYGASIETGVGSDEYWSAAKELAGEMQKYVMWSTQTSTGEYGRSDFDVTANGGYHTKKEGWYFNVSGEVRWSDMTAEQRESFVVLLKKTESLYEQSFYDKYGYYYE